MTSASELFSSRRFRPPRSPEPALRPAAVEPDRDRERDRDVHHHRLTRRHLRHRLHHHDCGSLRALSHGGPPHVGRHPCGHGGAPLTAVAPEFNGTSEFSSGNNSNREISTRNSAVRLTASDRLPGAVLQARARLLERLRGISLAGSRHNTTGSGISWDEFVVSDDFRVIDSGDWEADTSEGLESVSSFFDSTLRSEHSPSFPHRKGKKPPGLTRAVINTLRHEVFEDPGDSSGTSKVSLECCICLDKFFEGDSLIRLTCGHRFHPECLDPWVRTCGDCPYCRSRIVADPGAENRLSGATCAS